MANSAEDSTTCKTEGETGRVPRTVDRIEALGIEGLVSLFEDWGLPSFRARQVLRWLYQKDARSYEEMTDLPAALRSRLAQELPLSYPSVLRRQVSSDGTRKYLVRFADGTTAETVGLPAGDRLTTCFSTQAGCGMGCTFCATGQNGLSRSLLPGEMAWQVSLVAQDFGRRVSNAVAMGQGEPFANYEATLAALRLLNSKDGLAIGARHITLSTCGLIPEIRRFAQEPEQFTLAVSLHSAIQEVRDRIMPGVRRYPLDALRDACTSYADETGRRPTYEYALMRGVNDDERGLEALVSFCKGTLCHVNLIPINSTGGDFLPSAPSTIARFKQRLMDNGIETSVRTPRGADIDGACGQLRQRQD